MDLRGHLLSLLAPHQVGDEVLPGVVLADATTELGLRYRFDIGAGRLWVDVAPVEDRERWAARTTRLAFGYRTEGGRNPVDPRLGKRLCDALAGVAARNEAAVLSALARSVEEVEERDARVRRVEVDTLLEPAGSGEQSFYTLSPYVGCTIGCRFCYAQSALTPMRRLLGIVETQWGSYVDVRTNAPAVLKRELSERELRPVKFCPVVSDPYQPIERRERLTRRCLQILSAADRTWPVLLMTRSTDILDDIDLIASLGQVSAGVSLPTIDDETRAHFEPRAASVEQRLEVLRTLRSAGVPTHVAVQPLLPGSLEALADALAENVDSVTIDVLRGEESATGDFDAPKYEMSRKDQWQIDRARLLTELLRDRGVATWTAELPPAWL